MDKLQPYIEALQPYLDSLQPYTDAVKPYADGAVAFAWKHADVETLSLMAGAFACGYLVRALISRRRHVMARRMARGW